MAFYLLLGFIALLGMLSKHFENGHSVRVFCERLRVVHFAPVQKKMNVELKDSIFELVWKHTS